MSEPTLSLTLRSKRREIENSIKAYEVKLAQARMDLSHVSATIAIFESGGDERTAAFYLDTHRLLKKGEMVTLVRVELAKGEPLDTRELSRRIAVAKGLDGGDKVLLRVISYRLVRALLLQLRRGTISSPGKVRGVRMWALLNLD